MSRVFVATEDALRRRIVITVLAPELAATRSAERFNRESALAARLQHPHIVSLLSSGLAGAQLSDTMPFVDGESLRERINRKRPMAFDDIVHILEEVARALAYAHDESVVHRDIKPEHVILLPKLSCHAVGDLDAVARHDAARAGAAPAKWCSPSPSGSGRTVCTADACSARSPASPPALSRPPFAR